MSFCRRENFRNFEKRKQKFAEEEYQTWKHFFDMFWNVSLSFMLFFNFSKMWFADNAGICRPTLLLQETQSLACTLRILFKMSADESRSEDWTQIHNELTNVCKEALTYFLTLQREEHLEAWTCLLLLMITRIYKMPNDKVSYSTAISDSQKVNCLFTKWTLCMHTRVAVSAGYYRCG